VCFLFLLCVATGIAAPAQTFKTLLNFDGTNGSSPTRSLIQGVNGNLYGTTPSGGKSGEGTVFEITTEGKLTTLYNFLLSGELRRWQLSAGEPGAGCQRELLRNNVLGRSELRLE
jgi:uncharacterized repeat protein (TIGR03803 family)